MSTPGPTAPDLSFLDEASASRSADEHRRARLALVLPVVVTVTWVVAVSLAGGWDRVWANVVAAPTMVFGSFVAGSTPQGGGAVAFPVFTKGLGVPSEVARTFSLCIQTIGMGAASVAILVRRRPVSWPAVWVSVPVGVLGFAAGLLWLTDRGTPFWASVLPGPYVKVLFTLLVASMAFVVFLGSRVPVREVRISLSPLGARQVAFVVVGAFLGGLASSQVGSGSDVLLYLAVVVVLGLEPRVAVPTSVLVMAAVSACGLVWLGLVQGHLDVTVAGDLVTSVGGTDVTGAPGGGLDAGRYDLLGLWLAAVPIVCWGAPLGSAFAARLTTRQLAGFVALLAGAEVVTTALFLTELRTDRGLLTFALVGGAVLVGLLYLCVPLRHRIAGVRVDADRALTRDGVDVGPGYLAAGPSDVAGSAPGPPPGDRPDQPHQPGPEGRTVR